MAESKVYKPSKPRSENGRTFRGGIDHRYPEERRMDAVERVRRSHELTKAER